VSDPKNGTAAFDPRIVVLSLGKILPLRKIGIDPGHNRSYQRIVASIRNVGLIEPLVVYPAKGKEHVYTLLDGHLRVLALQELGITEAPCLVATHDEAYTYNHKVNRVPPIQEHLMIMKALSNGVSEERIAETLDVDVAAIRSKRDLLNGICPEAVNVLKEKEVASGALREFRKVKPLRQIEMAELMVMSGTFSASYAQCLLAATRQEQLLEPEKPKRVGGLRREDMARMEKEMETLSEDFRLIEETHGRNVLDLVLTCAYLRKLFSNSAVAKYVSHHFSDFVVELKKIVESSELEGT
jgi:ParB-like chromosome segregation protein Spo0J